MRNRVFNQTKRIEQIRRRYANDASQPRKFRHSVFLYVGRTLVSHKVRAEERGSGEDDTVRKL